MMSIFFVRIFVEINSCVSTRLTIDYGLFVCKKALNYNALKKKIAIYWNN